MKKTLGERVAVLEEQNADAKPLHQTFGDAISDLQDRTARIETKVDILVTANGHSKFRAIFPYGSAATFLAGLAAILKFLG